jgi:hypothetical protein
MTVWRASFVAHEPGTPALAEAIRKSHVALDEPGS